MDFVQRTLIFLPAFIICFLLLSSYSDDYLVRRDYVNESSRNIVVEEKVINYSSMTLRQKIAQMIIVRGDDEDMRFVDLNVGGIFLDKQKKEEKYKLLIRRYQDNSPVELFVSTDLEGAWTPFPESEEHLQFPDFSEIESVEEAYEVGRDHGVILKELGFNLNFAPVSEFSDEVYGGRVFRGTKEEIQEKLRAYIQGLESRVMGTCKHYPGRAMQANLHHTTDSQKITEHDLDLFRTCYEYNISAVMTSHHVVSGALDSGGLPSSVSPEVVGSIPDYVLKIADEINMDSLSGPYLDKTELYIELINAGNDVILDFELNSLELYRLLLDLEKAVNDGRISEDKIDLSVKKILDYKDYRVK